MAPSDHELGTALRALTTDQPLQPVDRLAAVTRKGQRIRRTRAVIAAAASVVLVAGILLGAVSLRPQGEERVATTPVTQWPDRSLKGQTGVAEGALVDWQRRPGASSRPVTWLFRGSLPVPDHDDVYTAVFLSSKDGEPVLVVSTTRRAQVDDSGRDRGGSQNPDDGTSPWVARTAPVTSASDHVGLYLEHGTQQYENVLFVLADPAARTLQWQMTALPHAVAAYDVTGASGGSIRSDDGVFLGLAGALTGPVTVTVTDARGRTVADGSLGGPLSQPGLASPPAPDVPPGWSERTSVRGQTELQEDSSWSGTALMDETVGVTGRLTGYIRCYGGGTMTFTLEDPDADGVVAGGPSPGPLSHGSAACDGQTHKAFPPHVVPRKGFFFHAFGDRLQAYAIRLGTVR